MADDASLRKEKPNASFLSRVKGRLSREVFDPPLFGSKNQANRDEWIARQLTALPAGLRLLDAGAGEMPYAKFCKHLTYVSQDISLYDGEGDSKGMHTETWDTSRIDLKCDILHIPPSAGTFDAILCSEVLEHVPDPVAVLNKLITLLNPGGYLIVTAPFNSLTHFAPYHFTTGFNVYFYQHHLAAAGLTIEAVDRNGDYLELWAQEIKRLPELAERGGERVPAWVRLAVKYLVSYADRISRRIDRGPLGELANFGIMIVARKPAA